MRFWSFFSSRRGRRFRLCYLGCLLLFCFLPPCLFHILTSIPSMPSSFSPYPQRLACSPSPLLDDSLFCTGGCQSSCFPRIRDLCFYSSKVKICKEASFRNPVERPVTSGSKGWNKNHNRRPDLPSIMRFNGERLTLPVVHSSCTGRQKWIRGLSMVADQRFLPYRKPNPHHEAEKLIPALLMSQKYGLNNTTLYWFSTRQALSEWAKGFLKAVHMDDKVQYLELPEQHDAAVCFEDTAVFSAPTNLWYIPDESSNKRLRELVLQYCSISPAKASWPVKSAAILDRSGGARRLANKHQIAETLSQVLNVSVKQSFSGVGSFCDQVGAVVQDDLLIVPHGSQNVNLIFARPGTIVIEVFPYLFYTEALRNFTHAAELHVYSLLGLLPQHNFLMWVFSFLGWDVCYYHFRWCKNYSRRQPIIADVLELEKLLIKIKQGYAGHIRQLAL